jgi:hypothetical protein
MNDILLTPIRLNELEILIQNSVRKVLSESQKTTQQPEADCWFDLTELCNYLPDKPVKPTVYGWVHKAAIPCNKKGKKLFFLKSEIDNWLKAGRKKTTTEIAAEADTYLRKNKGAKK